MMTKELRSIFTFLAGVNEVIGIYDNLSKNQVAESLGNPVVVERTVQEKVNSLRKEIDFAPFYRYATDFMAVKIEEVMEERGNREIYQELKEKNLCLLEEISSVILEELVEELKQNYPSEMPLREEWESFLTNWIEQLEITLSRAEKEEREPG